MKVCSKCNKEHVENPKRVWCKLCTKAYNEDYRRKHGVVLAEKFKAGKYHLKYNKSDKAKARDRRFESTPKRQEYLKQYYLEKKEEFRQRDRDWSKSNKEKICHKAALRRVKIQKATFTAFKKDIEVIYLNCPEGFHVDHIIPISHLDICGLHVPWNLQYLEAKDNLIKSNKLIGV